MKFSYKNLSSLFLISATGFFIFVIGFSLGTYFKKIETSQGVNFTLLFDAWKQIEEKFYKFSKEKKEKLLYGAIDGLIKTLEDPYSEFLDPEKTIQFKKELGGTYEGIGVEITIKEDSLVIISSLEGTPAKKAGLLTGDKILEIDHQSVEGISLVEAVMKIRGEKGTEATLKIKRNDKIFETKIKRETIEIPSLSFKIIDDIFLVQIHNFYEKTPLEFKKISEKILNSGSRKIILDLRNNPGGFLASAIEIGNFFIKKGEVILKEDSGKKRIREIKSEGPGVFSDYKVIVLINEGSASGAEILTGALKEQNKVLIIGEKSFGKGTVQELIDLKEGALKLSIAQWLLPSGKSIEGSGIEPDIKIETTPEELEKEKDPQLEKAIEEIKGYQ